LLFIPKLLLSLHCANEATESFVLCALAAAAATEVTARKKVHKQLFTTLAMNKLSSSCLTRSNSDSATLDDTAIASPIFLAAFCCFFTSDKRNFSSRQKLLFFAVVVVATNNKNIFIFLR